jgi:hypothetical protein
MSKDIGKKVKSHFTEWENIFANHINDKNIIFRICKELFKLNNKKTIKLKNSKQIE